MVETDWRQILSFSQKELNEGDKEKLCESLSWMEADDIELNFSDLKTLFRLAQDILKYKSEQVGIFLSKSFILISHSTLSPYWRSNIGRIFVAKYRVGTLSSHWRSN